MEIKRITSYREVTISIRFSKDFTDDEIKSFLKTDLSDFRNHEKILESQFRKLPFKVNAEHIKEFEKTNKNRFRTILYLEKNSEI